MLNSARPGHMNKAYHILSNRDDVGVDKPHEIAIIEVVVTMAPMGVWVTQIDSTY